MTTTQFLTFRLNEIRNAMVYGIRPTRTFQQAAIKFLEDNQHKKLLERYVYAFDRVMPAISNGQRNTLSENHCFAKILLNQRNS